MSLTFVNPEDDVHTFVLKEYHLSVVLPAQATTKTQFVANTVGAFQFLCDIPSHAPYMVGEFVVLPDRDETPSS